MVLGGNIFAAGDVHETCSSICVWGPITLETPEEFAQWTTQSAERDAERLAKRAARAARQFARGHHIGIGGNILWWPTCPNGARPCASLRHTPGIALAPCAPKPIPGPYLFGRMGESTPSSCRQTRSTRSMRASRARPETTKEGIRPDARGLDRRAERTGRKARSVVRRSAGLVNAIGRLPQPECEDARTVSVRCRHTK